MHTISQIGSTVKRIVQWAVALAAYAFLLYTLVAFDRYADFAATLSSASAWQYLALSLCLLLMPLNLFLEAWKWRTLLRSVEPATMLEAQRQVYYGMAAAFVTPYRIGDYPARILLLRNRAHYAPAAARAVLGSIMLTAVILLAGIPAFAFGFVQTSLFPLSGIETYITITLIMAALLLVAVLLAPLVARKYKITYSDCGILLLQSLSRYLCFSLQLWLALYFCGVYLPVHQALAAIPAYYLLVTVMPNMPAADLGIRGSLAVFVFGFFVPSAQPNIILATTVMWLVNTLLPVFFGAVGIRCSRSV